MTADSLTTMEIPESDDLETEPTFGDAKTESAEESARAILDELGAFSDEEADKSVSGSEGQEAEEPAKVDASEAARILANSKRGNKGKKRQVVEAKELDAANAALVEGSTPARIEPPARFPVEKKEWFNRQPREVQEEVTKGWGEIESHTTKMWQELNRQSQRYGQLEQVVNHYLPQWGMRGMTDVQAISELCAAQDMIIKDPLKAYDLMLRKSGITPEQLYEYRNGNGAQNVQPAPQPQNNFLTREELLRTLAERDQFIQGQSALGAAQAEIRQVQNELNSEGGYLYPELHSEAHLQRVKPLVEDLRKTQPGISWAEATKRAVHTLRLLSGNVGSPSSNGSRLPQQSDIERARAASVSVRPRGNGVIPTTTRAKPGESARESAEAVLAMFNNQN